MFGDGRALQQPVHVSDVADAVAKLLATRDPVPDAYNLPGAAPLTFDSMLDTICGYLGRRVIKVHVPAGCARPSLRLSSAGLSGFP